jgi:hypothetical protein
MRQPALVALMVLLVATAPLAALAESGTFFERRIERLVASPTPIGPLLLGSDRAAWRVDVPESAVVLIEARGTGGAPFLFRAERMDEPGSSVLFPTTHAGFLLSEPGAWRVAIDPLAGVRVDIRITFRGMTGGTGGGPASFTLTDLQLDRGCLFAGVCLP